MKKFLVSLFVLYIFYIPLYANEELYCIKDLFAITVTDSLELRESDDSYTNYIQDTLRYNFDDYVIFQQKGLSSKVRSALEKYCRIMIKTDEKGSGEYLCCNEDCNLSNEMLDELDSCAKQELAPGQNFVVSPISSTESTSKGVKYIRVYYERSGYNGDVCVNICFFFNYKYAAKMILSYRKSESDIWKSAISNTIDSFTWKEPFTSATYYAETSNEIEHTSNNFLIGVIVVVMTMCLFYIVVLSRHI